ncbi:MAG: amidohydrolase family protein [Pseudomonadota bacterium]
MEIVTASYVLPMTNGGPVVPDGAIAVELGRINAFGTEEELKKRFPDAQVKSHPGSVLMPGLVNSHCHLDMVAFYESTKPPEGEGYTKQPDFAETLVASIDFKHDAKPELVISGIQKGINRLIETGITCVGDMTHFEGTFKLLREMGLRAVVFPEILAGRGEAAQQKFEIALALVEKYTDATHDRVRSGLGPYAPYLLSRNLLKIISRHAKDASIPLMIHAAESFAEMEFFFDSQGPIATDVFPSLGWNELPPAQRKTPIEYLAEIGFFEAPTTVAGGMHLSHKDFPTLARHLARVVWCPTMMKHMKHGTFPLTKLSEHGVPMGLGTDFWHTHQGFSLWEEMRVATSDGAAPPATPREALRMATIGGARALGLDHLIGTLEEGKKADYIVVNVGALPGAANADALYASLVARAEPHHVRLVVVGGHILKSV